ncbi:hypothetical protein StoSoilB20_30890 [Arthrobacter sp. StoSoilB20]|nr:hypothetical protein StoSoilB20_30890 [Arthrobacter sp. StoSoilB20]
MRAKVDGGESRQLPVEPALWGAGSGKDDNVIVVSGVGHGLSSDPGVVLQGYRGACASLPFQRLCPLLHSVAGRRER